MLKAKLIERGISEHGPIITVNSFQAVVMLIEKSSSQCLGLICDESLICRGLNSNPGHFCGSILHSCSCGESCLLFLYCVGDRCGMMYSNEDRGRSRRPSAEDRGCSYRPGIRWSSDRDVG
jgi:hypothetical protein